MNSNEFRLIDAKSLNNFFPENPQECSVVGITSLVGLIFPFRNAIGNGEATEFVVRSGINVNRVKRRKGGLAWVFRDRVMTRQADEQSEIYAKLVPSIRLPCQLIISELTCPREVKARQMTNSVPMIFSSTSIHLARYARH